MSAPKTTLKRFGIPLLLALGLLISQRPCPADQPMASSVVDLDNEDKLVHCGLPVDKYIHDLKLDSNQKLLALKLLAPFGCDARDPVTMSAQQGLELALQHLNKTPSETSNTTSTSTVIRINNDGVRALNANNYVLGIEQFQKALRLDPTYTLARDNLAIAHNNYGLQLRSNPVAALKEFHQAIYLNRENVTTVQNLEGILRMMGKDPRDAAQRVELGDQAIAGGDYVGAMVEYSAALQLKGDPHVNTTLDDEYRGRNPTRKATLPARSALSIMPSSLVIQEDTDFSPYMSHMQQQIKSQWFPPEEYKSKEVAVVFKVTEKGELSNLKLQTSSGVESANSSALKAVEIAAPFRPIPENIRPDVQIQFSFNGTQPQKFSERQLRGLAVEELLKERGLYSLGHDGDTLWLWLDYCANFYKYSSQNWIK